MIPDHLKKNPNCFTEIFLHKDCLNLFLSDKISAVKETLRKKLEKRNSINKSNKNYCCCFKKIEDSINI